jgi:hypothetical protein
MNIPSNSSYSLSDYVITACALSEIAYLGPDESGETDQIPQTVIAAAITDYNPGNYDPNASSPMTPYTPIPSTVVWGPVYSATSAGDTYSLMYITQVTGSNEYFVVIRGTNFESAYSWDSEDFAIYATLPLNTLPSIGGSIPDDVMISQATFSGVSDLLQLVDPNSGLSATDFLSAMINTSTPDNKPYIYVTGHSLGGTLAPALYAYLTNTLVSDGVYADMAMWSFAGLTSGGIDFVHYINKLNPEGFVWRIQNSLDVAPLLFCGDAGGALPSQVSGIYPSPIDTMASQILTDLFQWANQTTTATPSRLPYLIMLTPVPALSGSVAPGVNFYQQPDANVGTIITGDIQGDTWVDEALYQHHSQTYYQMVYLFYTSN